MSRRRWVLSPGLLIALGSVLGLAGQTGAGSSFAVPNFSDLTIKTRTTRDRSTHNSPSSISTIDVLYLKGARQRREFMFERGFSGGWRSASITQCDARRAIELNVEAKTYATYPLGVRPSLFEIRRPIVDEARGAEVTTTSDAVDAGERRRFGHHSARRVRTTVTVEPGTGANTPASSRETDGWYIDLPGLWCSDTESNAYYFPTGLVVRAGGIPDRFVYKTVGTARRGYPVGEETRSTQNGMTTVTTIELVEFSEDRLDAALFDIPADYLPALPLLGGGHDMRKPDTIANRLQAYWNALTIWTRGLLALPAGRPEAHQETQIGTHGTSEFAGSK